MYIQKIIVLLLLLTMTSCGGSETKNEGKLFVGSSTIKEVDQKLVVMDSHPLVEAARKQIGVVTKYDTGYYEGGYPPEDSGACIDVISRALLELGYDFRSKIDADMRKNSARYFADFDSNINFRRVRNAKIFFDANAASLDTCVEESCLSGELWKPGDIVTFDQIPGGLWHIAIVSNKVRQFTNGSGQQVFVPYLIHNYGRGTLETDMLLIWPAPITGHYRLSDIN